MNGVIKAAAADARVRPIGDELALQHADRARPIPVRSPAELALEQAHGEIARLQSALIELGEASTRSALEARETGRREGLLAAELEEARRLAAIREAVELARDSWNDRLAGLDALAAMVARAALAKIFGDEADLADLVARSIAFQFAALRGKSVVAIHVSDRDFPDADALAALRIKAQSGAVDIIADAELAAGDCRFDLQLGHVDLGIGSQWRELSRFLEALAVPESLA